MSAEHSVHRPSSRRRRAIPAGLSAAALALAGLHAPPARADVWAYSTNTGLQLFGPAAAPVDLDTAAGAQDVLGFILPAPGFVVITFGAVCSVWGTAFQHGTVEVRVDTGPAGPSSRSRRRAGPTTPSARASGSPRRWTGVSRRR